MLRLLYVHLLQLTPTMHSSANHFKVRGGGGGGVFYGANGELGPTFGKVWSVFRHSTMSCIHTQYTGTVILYIAMQIDLPFS